MQYNLAKFLYISGPRPSCFRISQIFNSFASDEADIISKVRALLHPVNRLPHHILRWFYRAKQCKIVYTLALLPFVLWPSFDSTKLIRSSTTTIEWKTKVENPSRLTSELVGLLNLRKVLSLAFYLIATMLSV